MTHPFSLIYTLTLSVALSLTLAGCGQVSELLGYGKSAPDEFAVITKAPLILPPDYTLRPPDPNAIGARHETPLEEARNLVLSDPSPEPPKDMSPIEQALLKQAGALQSSDAVRRQIEEDDIIRAAPKKKNFVQRLFSSDREETEAAPESQ